MDGSESESPTEQLMESFDFRLTSVGKLLSGQLHLGERRLKLMDKRREALVTAISGGTRQETPEGWDPDMEVDVEEESGEDTSSADMESESTASTSENEDDTLPWVNPERSTRKDGEPIENTTPTMTEAAGQANR